MISGDKQLIFFVFSSCHLIFMLFVVGNIVREVA